MKKKIWIAAAIVIAVLLAVGAWFLLSGDRLSEGPAAVIDAMFTCPNSELFHKDAAGAIGLGVETTPEEREKMRIASEQLLENWEQAVGRYFAPNCLKPFYNMEALFYLAPGTMGGRQISVVKAELKESGFHYERALVTYETDGQQEQAQLKFSLDEDGLITQVRIEELGQQD